MINIGFYISNRNTDNVDCSDIFSGNPGIGGSEYNNILLAGSLESHYKDLNLTVYTDVKSPFPPNLTVKQVNRGGDLIRKTKEDNIHILILILGNFDNGTLDSFRSNEQMKIIIYGHNFFSAKDLNYCAKNNQIARLVCVGFEQMDLYRDHHAFKKMTAIYNGVDFDNIKAQSKNMTPFSQRPPHVTYIGNIIPQKGFHILAKAWSQILKNYPDAVLNVIGSGKLYDRHAEMGEYGIAEATYEKAFMPYLTDNNGRILPSVKFWGILGKEKNEILQKTRVGVPNPSGRTETFGIGVVEMQAFGALVTTIQCPGHLDTVCRSAGILYPRSKHQEKKLAEAVLSLLNRTENRYDEVMQFLESNFSIDKITGEWHRLLTDITGNKENPVIPVKANKKYRLKHWKEANRKFKNFIPFGYKIIPSLVYMEDILYKLNGLFKRDHLLRYMYRRYILKKQIE